MKTKRLIVLLFLFLASLTKAQDRTVEGKVTSIEGEELPGVNILIKGSDVGAVTDINGNYKIVAGDDAVLIFSYVGYAPQEVRVGTQSKVDVRLEESFQELGEVVITALGIERETKTLTYAQQTVDAENMKKARTPNFLQGLSGSAAGLQVVNSGTATGSTRVIIRGINSISGNNQPLFVLDGIPLDQTDQNSDQGSWGGSDSFAPYDYGDPLSNINPDDIESIEVLKGASASALYGSRANNGVILITTKTGQSSDGWGVSLNSNTMFTTVAQWPERQYMYGAGDMNRITPDGNEYANGSKVYDPANPGLVNINSNPRQGYAHGMPLTGFDVIGYNGETMPYSASPDGLKGLYQTGTMFTNGVSLDKSHKNGSFRLGYTNTIGEWLMDDREKVNRHNISLRATQNLTDNLNVDASMYYTYDEITNRVPVNGSLRAPGNTTVYWQPTMNHDNMNPYKDDLGFGYPFQAGDGTIGNPFWNLYENGNQDENNRIMSKIKMNYEIIDGFNVIGSVNGDFNAMSGYTFENPGAPYGDGNGRYAQFNQTTANWNYELLTTFNKDINDLSLSAMAGTNSWRYNLSRLEVVNEQLIRKNMFSTNNNAGVSQSFPRNSQRVLNSVFGSVNVGYKGIVFFDGTLRSEWSSTLPEENNPFIYPSLGTSFIFSEVLPENNILSFGKARLSWAVVGNSADPYKTIDVTNYGGIFGSAPYVSFLNNQPNPVALKRNSSLRNEETRSIEFGVEGKLFNNKVDFNFTYYSTESSSNILQGSTSVVTGFTEKIENVGVITNKGVELFLGANVLDGPVKWDIGVNYSHNRGHVKTLSENIPFVVLNDWGGSFAQIRAVQGEPYGQIYASGPLRNANGEVIIPSTQPQAWGSPGVPVYLNSPIEALGNAQPDWIGGVRNSVSYKGFSLNVLFDIKVGGDILSMSHARSTQFGLTPETLEGRDEFTFSNRILGENNEERAGRGIDGTDYHRGDRVQGALFDGVLHTVNEDGSYTSIDQPNNIYVAPGSQFNTTGIPNKYFWGWIDHRWSVFDASYVKLRELSLGYSLSNEMLAKTPFNNVTLSIVGRNLAILHQNTPNGIDPEASTNSGNGQGLEFGSFLPTRSVGFNLNFSF